MSAMQRRRARSKGADRSTYDGVRRAALALPDVEEGTSYGTPALKVRGKLFVRLWEDGETIVLRCGAFDREQLLESEPAVFFLTDHYRNYPWVLVRLAALAPARLPALLAEAWRQVAPKSLVTAYDARSRRGT